MTMKLSKILVGIACGAVIIIGCAYNHPTNATTANRRCNALIQWDDCARSPNCTQARAWLVQNGEYKESFVCIHKYLGEGEKKKLLEETSDF
jgi:hypothetical protein